MRATKRVARRGQSSHPSTRLTDLSTRPSSRHHHRVVHAHGIAHHHYHPAGSSSGTAAHHQNTHTHTYAIAIASPEPQEAAGVQMRNLRPESKLRRKWTSTWLRTAKLRLRLKRTKQNSTSGLFIVPRRWMSLRVSSYVDMITGTSVLTFIDRDEVARPFVQMVCGSLFM